MRTLMGNDTSSVWIPEVDYAKEQADQAFAVFLGVAFVAFVCVVLSSTVISSTLQEVDEWARRTARAEMQLSEATEFPGAIRVDGVLYDEDEVVDPPPSRGCAG